MHSRNRGVLLAILAGLVTVLSISASADVPRFFTYQGVLKDAGGNPVAGPVDLVIQIHTAAVGGSSLFSENWVAVPLDNGVFTIQVGGQTVGGIPGSALSTPTPYLGVAVDGGTELPRVALTSAPYSFKGGVAEKLVEPGNFDVVVETTAAGHLQIPEARVIFGAGDTPLITAGHDNVSDKRMWIGHSQSFPTWGIQYRDISSDGYTSDTLEFIAGDQTRPRFGFELATANLKLFNADGTLGAQVSRGSVRAYDGDGAELGALAGNGSGGQLTLKNTGGTTTVSLTGAVSGSNGSELRLRDAAGVQTVLLDGHESPTGSAVALYKGTGAQTVEIDADDGDGAAVIRLRNATGSTTITLDGDNGGDGRITTQELVVSGGSDVSEKFDISGDTSPGTVVCIDPDSPGRLLVSSGAYDRTVAGVISGAGGIKTGLTLGQDGSVADGKHSVALTGRVFCKAVNSNGAIRPGDLLTTSPIPGHAMKVTDHIKAQGAVIGKAMTALDESTGLVLALVSLQ